MYFKPNEFSDDMNMKFLCKQNSKSRNKMNDRLKY